MIQSNVEPPIGRRTFGAIENINSRIRTKYNFNFIHSIPHIFSTICIRPHVLEWIVKQGGWVSIGRAYIMVEQKDKMILSKNHPSDIRKEIEIRFRHEMAAERKIKLSNKVNWQY